MTIDDIRLSNAQHGQFFFSPSTMRFFKSRVGREVYEGPGGVYFATSEQGPSGIRRYTVRQFIPETGWVKTAGEHQQYGSSGAARQAALKLAKG